MPKYLIDLPNIGKTLANKLMEAGIKDPEVLINCGSKEAWQKIKRNNPDACINMLMALEGAIQGIRWHSLSEETKTELKEFYQNHES
jgi:DNA transformation protein